MSTDDARKAAARQWADGVVARGNPSPWINHYLRRYRMLTGRPPVAGPAKQQQRRITLRRAS